MNYPIKLILIGLFVLLSGCGESADLKKTDKGFNHSTEIPKSPVKLLTSKKTKFVAGLTPNQRPANAPIIREFSPDSGWRARSLTGIRKPLPPGLGFLNSQEAWYTPFNQPGMPGYYDLRKWHHKSGKSIYTSR